MSVTKQALKHQEIPPEEKPCALFIFILIFFGSLHQTGSHWEGVWDRVIGITSCACVNLHESCFPLCLSLILLSKELKVSVGWRERQRQSRKGRKCFFPLDLCIELLDPSGNPMSASMLGGWQSWQVRYHRKVILFSCLCCRPQPCTLETEPSVSLPRPPVFCLGPVWFFSFLYISVLLISLPPLSSSTPSLTCLQNCSCWLYHWHPNDQTRCSLSIIIYLDHSVAINITTSFCLKCFPGSSLASILTSWVIVLSLFLNPRQLCLHLQRQRLPWAPASRTLFSSIFCFPEASFWSSACQWLSISISTPDFPPEHEVCNPNAEETYLHSAGGSSWQSHLRTRAMTYIWTPAIVENRCLLPKKCVTEGFPGGSVVKNLPANAGIEHKFNPWSRKIPHATEQLNLCAATIEPVL